MKWNAVVMGCIMTLMVITGCTKIDATYKYAEAPVITFKGSAYDYLMAQPNVYDSLLKALSRVPDLVDSLKTRSVTLFAPNNRSFEIALQNINQARLDSVPRMPAIDINAIPVKDLDSVLCKYIIKDKIKSTDLRTSLSDGRTVNAIKYNYMMNMKLQFTNAAGYQGGGPTLINFSDMNKEIFIRYWVTTKTTTIDIQADNAYINLLESGHDFGFGATFIRAVNKR